MFNDDDDSLNADMVTAIRRLLDNLGALSDRELESFVIGATAVQQVAMEMGIWSHAGVWNSFEDLVGQVRAMKRAVA